MQVLPVLRVTKKVSEIRPGSGVGVGMGVGNAVFFGILLVQEVVVIDLTMLELRFGLDYTVA